MPVVQSRFSRRSVADRWLELIPGSEDELNDKLMSAPSQTLQRC